MKYYLIIILFFVGCYDNNQQKPRKIEKKKIYIEDIVKSSDINYSKPIKQIIIDDLKFSEINNSITYSFKNSKILIFTDDSNLCDLQIKELQKLHIPFYIIKNKKLEKHFNISKYPTIIITKSDNKIKKYNGFMPSEILKYELKKDINR